MNHTHTGYSTTTELIGTISWAIKLTLFTNTERISVRLYTLMIGIYFASSIYENKGYSMLLDHYLLLHNKSVLAGPFAAFILLKKNNKIATK